ncbi:diguanylate cyclase [Thalassotalea ganghwensis]
MLVFMINYFYYFVILASIVFANTSLANTSLGTESFSDDAIEERIYQEPLATYQTILKEMPANEQGDQHQHLWWLLRKAQAEHLLYFYEDFEETINQAFQLLTKDSPAAIVSRFNLFKGVLARIKGQYNDSSRYIAKALEQAKQNDLEHIYIQAKQENAYTQSLTELFEVSLSDMQEAYVKAYGMNDKFLIAVINETYGAIYGYMHDYAKSIEYYQKALEAYRNLGYKAHIAEAIYGLASTYRYWKKFDLAIKYFKLYQDKVNYTPNPELSYYAAYGLGMTLSEQGKCQEALEVIDDALSKKGVKDYNVELYKNQAVCFLQLNQLQEASLALDSAKRLLAELPDLAGTTWDIETIKIASQLAHKKGEYDTSYQLLQEYHDKYVEILMTNSTERLIQARAEMELERQEVERALALQRDKVENLQQETLAQKHLEQQYFMVFLLLVIAIIVIILVMQHRSNQRMKALSITDPLSGLYNRRYIFNYLDNVLTSMSIDKGELSLLLLDIDNFKQINDQYGHPAGDYVILNIAKIGHQVLRTEDVMARVGGEEFLCVLPRTSASEAEKIAQRMLKAVESSVFTFKNIADIKVTTSIGLSSYSKVGQSVERLYAEADMALYQAKRNGKNTVVSFTEKSDSKEQI